MQVRTGLEESPWNSKINTTLPERTLFIVEE
jgi:hypothetical protein